MQIEAFPTEFVALTDGVYRGQEHVILHLQHAVRREPHGFALSLRDAQNLFAALQRLLPDARQIQLRIVNGN